MPFTSERQRRFMHAKHPEIAEKWEEEAKREGKPAVRRKRRKKVAKADLSVAIVKAEAVLFKHLGGSHNQKDHGHRHKMQAKVPTKSRPGVAGSARDMTAAERRSRMSGNVKERNEAVGTIGQGGHQITQGDADGHNPNPFNDKAVANLKKVGHKVPAAELAKVQKKLSKAFRDLPDPTPEQMKRHERELAIRRGEEGGTRRRVNGNVYDRRARSAYLLREYGDGHTAPCYKCGVRLGFDQLEHDKMDPRIGYSMKNIAPACGCCNGGRNNRPFLSFMRGRTGVRKADVVRNDPMFEPGRSYRAPVNRDLMNSTAAYEYMPREVFGVPTVIPVMMDGIVDFYSVTIGGWPIDPTYAEEL